MFEFKINGIVQGVGFRPYIYNSAKKNKINGTVQNTNEGVIIICDNKQLMQKILKTPPKLSKIEKIDIKLIKSPKSDKKYSDFKILESEKSNSYSQIPADLNLCVDCVRELKNKSDFRYNYPFISCTNCGPRYSIIKSTPYDREKTSFAKFKLCEFCESEYKNPTNRRYHAQTIACEKCGPKITLYKNNKIINCENPIKEVSILLLKNEIIAIKGVGGFHLVCNINIAKKLKKITKRDYKPFALLAKNIFMIKKYAIVSNKEKDLILSKKRPIVLLEKIDKSNLKEISELSSLGFMLPYTPIHYLLFENISEPLIFTSSNLPSHPITIKKEEQFVEYVLDFNRDIENFVDDSIIKVIENKELLIRRSRGFAPNEILIPTNYRNYNYDIISVGSELKNTFCIKKNNKLILSPHIGNIYNYENFKNFKKVITKLQNFTQTKPKLILCDSNLQFNSSIFAKEYKENNNIKLENIGHHIAHGFSVALEYNLKNFISIVCDGTGLGNDETVWGGEVFFNDKRIGHLETQTLIGGDIANKEPIRILVGILSNFLDEKGIEKILKSLYEQFVTSLKISNFLKQKEQNFNCIETSSCGRVLDCISILLGFSDVNFYEGRGAMLLESNSSKKVKLYFKPIIKFENNKYILMTTPLFEFIVNNLDKISKENLARFSQIYLAKGLYEIAKKYNKNKNLEITFSGGCAYNSIMTSFMIKNKVLLNKKIPCGDGGISIGQIAYFLWKQKNK